MTKLWLDDDLVHRVAPDGWTHVQTVEDAIQVLETQPVSHLSLDHDLGENQKTGYDLVKWIEERYFVQDIKPPEMKIHSANPVGRDNMMAAISNINRVMRSVG